MTRKGRAITLSINDREKQKLERLALLFGKKWGENKPNISKLIKAIANGELAIAPNHDWSNDRINALERTRQILIDRGNLEEAITIAQLLLERNEPNRPFRSEVQKFLDETSISWIQVLEEKIKRNHPFRLSYQDASARIWIFTIRYAEIAFHENRYYLDCWAEETEGNQNMLELKHNWSLRLDRIPPETSITELQKSWRSGLDGIDVEFYLYGSLAYGYKTKQEADLENDWHPTISQTRRVVRVVTSPFWFLREILRYGSNCEIISPPDLRDRLQQELLNMLQQYQD